MANETMTEVTKEHLDRELSHLESRIDVKITHLTRWVQGAIGVGLLAFSAFAWQINAQNARTDFAIQQILELNGEVKSNIKANEYQDKAIEELKTK